MGVRAVTGDVSCLGRWSGCGCNRTMKCERRVNNAAVCVLICVCLSVGGCRWVGKWRVFVCVC